MKVFDMGKNQPEPMEILRHCEFCDRLREFLREQERQHEESLKRLCEMMSLPEHLARGPSNFGNVR